MTTGARIKALALIYIERHGVGTADQVAKFIEFSNGTARKYLIELCGEMLIHDVVGERQSNGARHVFFKLGPRPAPVATVAKAGDCATPFRPVTQVYPPNHRRDLLVCAMFAVPLAMSGAHA